MIDAHIFAPLAFAIVGAVVYGYAEGKAGQLGLWTFGAGMIWIVAAVGRATVHL